jgi:hypothetical protein
MKKNQIFVLLVFLSAASFSACKKVTVDNQNLGVLAVPSVPGGGSIAGINYTVQNDWIKFNTVQDWVALFQSSEADRFAVYDAARGTGNFTSTMDVWLDTLGTTQSICANYQDTKENADSVFSPVFGSFLNQDGLVQIGAYICKVDQVQKRCLVLNEANMSQLSDLRNGTVSSNITQYLPSDDVMLTLFGIVTPGPMPTNGPIPICDPNAPSMETGVKTFSYADKRKVEYGVVYKNNFLHKILTAKAVSLKKGVFGIWYHQDRSMNFKVYQRKWKIACGSASPTVPVYPIYTGYVPSGWPWRHAIIYDDAYEFATGGSGGQLSKYWWDGQVQLLDWYNVTSPRFSIKFGY